MTATLDPTDHHISAAIHHDQAAHFHREALHHYMIGKDYAHAAHQALTAHGHELRALEHAEAASGCYVGHEDSPLPGYLARPLNKLQSTALVLATQLDGPAHHVAAAEHHDAAVQHHVQAGAHCSAEHYIRANHETSAAIAHGKHAIFHSDQAAIQHMKSHGSHLYGQFL